VTSTEAPTATTGPWRDRVDAVDWDSVRGELDRYTRADPTTDTGLRLNAYHAAPGTPEFDALRLLASWTAPEHAR